MKDNISTTEKREKKKLARKYNADKLDLLRLAKQIAITALIAFIVFRFIVGFSVVTGSSMYPTLADGDIVFYVRVFQSYDRGDVVSVRMPSGDYYVKRIVAAAGDTVDIKDGRLYVNGEALDEPYAAGLTEKDGNSVSYPYTVKENSVFVLGDNREESTDSRTFGAVNTSQIKGELVFTE